MVNIFIKVNIKLLIIIYLLFCLVGCSTIRCHCVAYRSAKHLEEHGTKVLDYGCTNGVPWIKYDSNGRCRQMILWWYVNEKEKEKKK